MRAGKLATGVMWGAAGAVGFGVAGFGMSEIMNSGEPTQEQLAQCGAAIGALGHSAVVEAVEVPAACKPFKEQFPESINGETRLLLTSEQLERFIAVDGPGSADKMRNAAIITFGVLGAVVVGSMGYQKVRWQEIYAAEAVETQVSQDTPAAE